MPGAVLVVPVIHGAAHLDERMMVDYNPTAQLHLFPGVQVSQEMIDGLATSQNPTIAHTGPIGQTPVARVK